MKCQGITTTAAKTMKKFVCNICTALKPGCTSSEAVTGEAALARFRKTKSPDLPVLQAQLLAATKLAVEGKGEAKLGNALACYEVCPTRDALLPSPRAPCSPWVFYDFLRPSSHPHNKLSQASPRSRPRPGA